MENNKTKIEIEYNSANNKPTSSNTEEALKNRALKIKGNCNNCSHYKCCPRMKGENICYGKKV